MALRSMSIAAKSSVSSALPARASPCSRARSVGLLPKRQGRIRRLRRQSRSSAASMQRQEIERRWGILFQQGALFSSLTVGENVEFPIREYLDVSDTSDDRNRHHQAGNGRRSSRMSTASSLRNSPAA